MPGFPGLFIVASCAGGVSATGVADRPAMAATRHDAERAERLVATQHPVRGRLTGWAAGRDGPAAVAERARQELVERSAALRWWQKASALAVAPAPARTAFAAAGRAWPRQDRRLEGLAMLAGGGTPVLLAWSLMGPEPRACLAMAAHSDVEIAAWSVRRELCQMEFARALLDRRAALGMCQPGDVAQRAGLARRDAALRGRLSEADLAAYAPPVPHGPVAFKSMHMAAHLVIQAAWADGGGVAHARDRDCDCDCDHAPRHAHDRIADDDMAFVPEDIHETDRPRLSDLYV
ncbi:MAG: YcaO-like family protein [Pseudomonadota bacterium]